MRYREFAEIVRKLPAHAHNRELLDLVIALEDKRFNRHNGVDVFAGFRALLFHLSGHSNGGASTIDMQFVRTLTGRRQRTFKRKLLEIIFAVRARRQFGAQRIINCYLDVAYTGTNLTGMEAVALTLFKRSVDECSLREKAILAASLLRPVPKVRSKLWVQAIWSRSNLALARAGRAESNESASSTMLSRYLALIVDQSE